MKTATVTQNGQTYEIPEMWIVGRMRALNDNTPTGYRAAIDMWIEQEAMTARLETNREKLCRCGHPPHSDQCCAVIEERCEICGELEADDICLYCDVCGTWWTTEDPCPAH